jgi:hypothetical protein
MRLTYAKTLAARPSMGIALAHVIDRPADESRERLKAYEEAGVGSRSSHHETLLEALWVVEFRVRSAWAGAGFC